MISPDVLDVLLDQHDQMRRLSTAVQNAAGAEKSRLFAELGRLVRRHEFGDRMVVHPAARRRPPEGDRVVVACMVEEGNIERAMTGLHVLGTAHAAFDEKFTVLRQAIVDHAAHEERDEFPILRRNLTTARLHMMAGELHDVQIMGVN